MFKHVIVIMATLVLGMWVFSAGAGMRCGRELVSEGDSKFRLLEACGEPDLIERVDCDCDCGQGRGLRVEKVYYRRDRGGAEAVTVKGGVVVKIETERD